MIRYDPDRVAPFGHPRINAYPRLPEAFRRLVTSFLGPRRQGIHRVLITRKLASHAQMLGVIRLACQGASAPCRLRRSSLGPTARLQTLMSPAPPSPRLGLHRRSGPHADPSTSGWLTWKEGKPSLPRKEVIQPQLPLRLPCYDFVPITSPTLDGCPPGGLAHRLQVLPAFMT